LRFRNVKSISARRDESRHGIDGLVLPRARSSCSEHQVVTIRVRVLPTFGYYSGGMWNARLRKPIHLKDGRTIKTLSDAKYFLLSLPARSAAAKVAVPRRTSG
jgi:hypothetical protein